MGVLEVLQTLVEAQGVNPMEGGPVDSQMVQTAGPVEVGWIEVAMLGVPSVAPVVV